MIRSCEARDTQPLTEMAERTGVFKPLEIVAFREVLDDYHAFQERDGHRAVCLEVDGRLLGMAYFAPAAMTDRTWYLWWILVEKSDQSRGLGSQLIRFAEQAIQQEAGRLLLIETSSLPHYGPTRAFYVKNGYQPAAVIPDYYTDGDDLVVFSRRFLPRAVP